MSEVETRKIHTRIQQQIMRKRGEESANMWIKTVCLVALVVSMVLAPKSEATGQNTTIVKRVNGTTPRPSAVEGSTPGGEALETAPSITSVHQVWTSSSSGSLDELSPEVISKIRQDVPFLAAYALRPRLVGAAPTTVMPPTRQQPHTQPEVSFQKLDTSSSNVATLAVNALKGASSRASARQVASSSLFPKLGDFSEFNIETSSTSKSEHHHRRKTSLKRQKNEGQAKADDREEGMGIGSSKLVKRKKKTKHAKVVNARKSSKFNKRGSSRGNNERRSRVAASNRLRQRKSNKLNIVKNGRYFQEGSIESRPESNGLDVEMRARGRDTTSLMLDDDKTKVDKDDSGVKGGSARGTSKPPFYASKRPVSKSDELDGDSEEASLSNGRERGSTSGADDSTTEATNRLGGGADEEAGDLDDDEPEPKRVGDPDVEDDGDTVLVEPKSDGVDDDPALPDYDPAGSPDSDEVGDRASPGTSGADAPKRPTPAPSRDNDDGDDEEDGAGGGQVTGGGIGTTIDGSRPAGAAGAAGGDMNEGEEDRSDDGPGGPALPGGAAQPPSSTKGSTGGDKKFNSSGVEFADEGGQRGETGAQGGQSGGRAAGPEAGGAKTNSGRDDDGDFGERNKVATMRPRGGEEPETDYDDDLDYRDETDSNRDGAKRPVAKGGADRAHDDDERGLKDAEPGLAKGHRSAPAAPKSAPGAHEQHCDDGSYNHHHEHHHGAGRHGHHDTIDWLRGAIPGEPEEDYPILSRVNGSNFKCSQQKYPGYYADVESRCQIFHICQADGRQDSFLCPNGTIFSQKTLVCVWWNGFNCEDAPKFYHLNELLYKKPAGSDSPQAAAPALPGLMIRPAADSTNKISPLRPPGMLAADGDAAQDDSSIESLVRMMRDRARPHETETMDDGRPGGARGPANGARLAPNDEASIQRKSTNLDDETAGLDERAGSSRLQSRDHIPRRSRRASIRQAPPKLKSRRVPRNSRRRKLRHGIKPRRRA